MMTSLFEGITLPLEDPILKFLLILTIILAAPLLLNKLKRKKEEPAAALSAQEKLLTEIRDLLKEKQK